LHAPDNYIVGGGIFAHANIMPCSLAWNIFGKSNGADSLQNMRAKIACYRNNADRHGNFDIGCRILTQTFFFKDDDWIPAPKSWNSNIVKYKTYNTDEADGFSLWEQVTERMRKYSKTENQERFGSPCLIEPHLGQALFRIKVIENYTRRCAVTLERTLPVLETAHIKPYSQGGSHWESNGLLLRSDIHKLFDNGYVTVTPELDFLVSDRIRQEFENGRHYYDLHGSKILVPKNLDQHPDPEALAWHNENCFNG